jgi:EAL domain-containing protein (putative c-di-GMP-specific phosphodiesterase class I)
MHTVITGHHYRLEPLVDLISGKVLGHELLTGENACPSYDMPTWRHFYRFLENEVQDILQKNLGLLFINLDGMQMLDSGVEQSILHLKPFAERLVLEWTEQHFHSDHYIAVLNKIDFFKSNGFQIAVDDIGAGIDGMGRAHSCRPHFGKIDGQILERARQSEEGQKHLFIRGMVDSLRSHGARVIVEWIESQQDRDIALAAGADFGQGYLWTRPQKRIDHDR